MKRIFASIIAVLFFASCQEEFNPPIGELAEQYVVEGYIEAGDAVNPTFILITKSIPFFNELKADQYAELFVAGAEITVDDGDKVVEFTELCLSDLPEGDFKDQIASELGIDLDLIFVDVCIYIDLANELTREEGRSYDLTIVIDDEVLTSTTTIPVLNRLDSFQFREIPGEKVDTLSQLFCYIEDSENQDFYRYFTDDDFGVLTPPFNSVTDDVQFNGQEFTFPISQAENSEDFDINTFGFFTVGDTITLKWCAIDKSHFDFWNTFEYSLNGQGSPFSGYTRIADNIEGGFGIWGGYSVQLEELIVIKEE